MHANIIRFALLLLCASIQVSVWGQIREVRNVPTPEVSNLGTFGSVPVGHYTGTPNISVPLYTMKVGKLSIPLQAMYHTANVKPHVPPTCLGIGWALSAGGYISRSVKGCQDEKCANSVGLGYYFNHSRINAIENSPNKPQQLITSANMSNQYTIDLSADEFTFNFNGYSGTFFMDKDSTWRVISDDNIKVELTNVKLISELESRFHLRHYAVGSNQRFFDKFTLTTPDGTRYEFGGGNATEYSVPYYNQVSGELIASCWRLSKITTVDNRVVTFDYATDSFMCDIHYAPQKLSYNIIGYSGHIVNTGKSGYSGFLMMPSRLTQITCDNEIITFDYDRVNYGYKFKDNSDNLTCFYWQGNSEVRYLYYLDQELNNYRLCGFMGIEPSDYANETRVREAIANQITHDYLSSITVRKSNNKILLIDFAFNQEKPRKLLSGIKYNVWQYSVIDDETTVNMVPSYPDSPNGGINPPSTQNPIELEIGNKTMIYRYTFDYYKNNNPNAIWPDKYPLIYTDSWGYYSDSGQWNGVTDGQNVSDYTARTPSISSTKAGVLKSITYPTGGKTEFAYELNDYSKVFDLYNQTVNEISGTPRCSGGLRVKTLSNYDSSGNLLYSKEYIYKYTENTNEKSSGISKGDPCFHEKFLTGNGNDYIDFYSFDDINPYPMNFNTPSVGYSTVIEKLKDNNGNILSTTKYQYTNYDADINNNAHMDVQADCTANVFGNRIYSCAPFTSMALERGKLVSKEVMDGNDQVLNKNTFKYERSAGNPYTTVSQDFYHIQLDQYNPYRLDISYMYKTYTNRYLVSVSKKEETMDNGKYKFEEEYKYHDKYGLPIQKTVVSNNGERLQTSYFYNTDYYDSKNMILPARIEEKKNGACSETKYNYRLSNPLSNTGVPYIDKQTTTCSAAKSSLPAQERIDYTVTQVDEYGNPIEVDEKGITTLLIWSYKGQRLIASIQNASYLEVRNTLDKELKEFSAMSAPSISMDVLRTELPKALVCTYKYDNRLNLISKTEPNGMTYTYSYDFLDRLTGEYRLVNGTAELLNAYKYNYKTK